MKNSRFVLTGGLGNQLFQFAAALSHSEANVTKVELETRLGKPRTTEGVPDLLEFRIPNATLHNSWSSVINRALGYSLRISLKTSNSFQIKILKMCKKLAISALSSLLIHNLVRVISPSNLGFDSSFNIAKKGALVIGYFQSYRFFNHRPECVEVLRNLELAGGDPVELRDLRSLASIEKPLVVHIRRGDYRLEDNFGLLSADYYSQVIPTLFASGKYGKIWLFSDDLESAVKCIPSELVDKVRPIEEIDKSPAATLQAMRLGYGYVIANSSFSWWGAFLSIQEGTEIHAPKPWFKGMEEPRDLLPPSWTCHQSIWE